MPKAKRFQNPLKLAPQPQSEAHPPTRAPVHSSPPVHSPQSAQMHLDRPLEPSPSIHKHPSPSIQTHIGSTTGPSPSEPTPPHDPIIDQGPSHAPTNSSSGRRVGRESTQFWSVETIGT